jgi:hypothetical protein
VRRRLLALAIVGLLAGCGVPQDRAKQAEELHSLAAEGALLAHEASEGSHNAFTTEHAEALRKLLGQLRPAIEDGRLARRAAAVDAALARLARDPGDRGQAARLERRLEELAG